jgi:hypothetical protein
LLVDFGKCTFLSECGRRSERAGRRFQRKCFRLASAGSTSGMPSLPVEWCPRNDHQLPIARSRVAGASSVPQRSEAHCAGHLPESSQGRRSSWVRAVRWLAKSKPVIRNQLVRVPHKFRE